MAERNIASSKGALPGCVRRRETRCVIMKNRGSWCRRKVRKRVSLLQLCADHSIILSAIFVTGMFGGGYKRISVGGEEVRFDGFVDRQYAALRMQQRELERRIGIIGNTRKSAGTDPGRMDTGKPGNCMSSWRFFD